MRTDVTTTVHYARYNSEPDRMYVTTNATKDAADSLTDKFKVKLCRPSRGVENELSLPVFWVMTSCRLVG
jgi:hypothetical protein